VLRLDVAGTPHLPADSSGPAPRAAAVPTDAGGWLVIVSQRHREQPKNVADCLAKLSAIMERQRSVRRFAADQDTAIRDRQTPRCQAAPGRYQEVSPPADGMTPPRLPHGRLSSAWTACRVPTPEDMRAMPTPRDIDTVLKGWEFRPGEVNARLVKARNGRHVIQMRIDMGLLQMETDLRPDGTRPHGAETYYDYLVGEVIREGGSFRLSKEQRDEVDREFIQFYHRRLCWPSLREYRRAARDADHSLAFMDFVREHSADDEWTLSHEQYRPFVLFHRVQAAASPSWKSMGPRRRSSRSIKAWNGFGSSSSDTKPQTTSLTMSW